MSGSGAVGCGGGGDLVLGCGGVVLGVVMGVVMVPYWYGGGVVMRLSHVTASPTPRSLKSTPELGRRRIAKTFGRALSRRVRGPLGLGTPHVVSGLRLHSLLSRLP